MAVKLCPNSLNYISMEFAVASVRGQFDRLCLGCICGQKAPSSSGSERKQAVMDCCHNTH